MAGVYLNEISPWAVSIDGKLRRQYKVGTADCVYRRVIKESQETLCSDPDHYLETTVFIKDLRKLENEGEVQRLHVCAETIIHRYLDNLGLRCKPGATKEIFFDVTPAMIEAELTRNGFTFTRCSFREYQKTRPWARIINGEVQDKKIVLGKRRSKNAPERERCEKLAGKNLCVKEIFYKTRKQRRLYDEAKVTYVKKNVTKKYGLDDFEWDIEHDYLTIETD